MIFRFFQKNGQERHQQVIMKSLPFFKKEGVYYMITSGRTGWDPNEARSFQSKSI